MKILAHRQLFRKQVISHIIHSKGEYVMDLVRHVAAFVAAADLGSFSAAAIQLRTSQPTVSKLVAELERHVGERLLNRTTRALALTEAGALYLHQARALLAAAAATETALKERDPLAGLVRFSAPPSLANARIIPMLGDFLAAHPQVEIDARLSDTRLSLNDGTLDFSIRVGGLGDEPLAAQLVGIARRMLVATPDYLARHGTPLVVADLSQHRCLHYRLYDGRRRWQFQSGASVEVGGPLSIDNPEGLRVAALAGLGIVQSAIWLFERDLADGRLVPVLAHDPPAPMPIHLVTARSRPISVRTQRIADYLAARFAADPLLRIDGGSVGKNQAAS
jgi:LysR family transcriptional regulator, regulator for bpeEF and oprC